MKRFVTPKQMKVIEKNSDSKGTSYMQLMNNAGCELAQFIASLPIDTSKEIIILAGSGNNGGDGFVAAKYLCESGFNICVVLMNGEPSTEISAKAFCELSDSHAEVLYLNDNIEKVFDKISLCSIIVDSIFGTGFHGELPPQIKACFSFISRSKAKVIAVDLPSGGNAENGQISENTLKCEYTLTFQYEKLGFLFMPLKELCGEVIPVDIGISEQCLENIDRPIFETSGDMMTRIIPIRSPYSHKGNYGRLVNVSGSEKMPGAAAMSTSAALRCGIGLCTLASVKDVTLALSSNIHESMFLPLKSNFNGNILYSEKNKIIDACANATAILIGCGLGNDDDIKKLVADLIEKINCPIILDADGLNCISDSIDIIKNAKAGIILTPHVGELARLVKKPLDDVIANRFGYAAEISANYHATVVSKGVPTIICGDNGFTYVNRTGNSGLAKGGSGDVLAGMIASFTAQGIPLTDACVAGAYYHGLAADIAAKKLSQQGMIPTDIIKELPLLFN